MVFPLNTRLYKPRRNPFNPVGQRLKTAKLYHADNACTRDLILFEIASSSVSDGNLRPAFKGSAFFQRLNRSAGVGGGK